MHIPKIKRVARSFCAPLFAIYITITIFFIPIASVKALAADFELDLVTDETMEISILWGEKITGNISWKTDWGGGTEPHELSSTTGLSVNTNPHEGFLIMVNSTEERFRDINGKLTNKPSMDLEVFVDHRIGWINITQFPFPITPIIIGNGTDMTFTVRYRVWISWHDRGTYNLHLVYTLFSIK